MSTIRRTFVLTLALIAPAFFVSAQSTRDVRATIQNKTPGSAAAVRCVTADGTTFESCAGTGGGGGGTPIAAADGMANPTAPQELSYLFVWNGTTYDKVRGDTTSGMWVNIKNASIAVTGTFWQATQPVSIAATIATNLAQYNGSAVGAGNALHVQPGTAATWDVSDRAARVLGVVTPPAITKGTQGTTGFTVQELKDAGRTRISFTADAVAVATTEGLVTFTKNVAGTATASQTTYSVTASKTFHVQQLTISLTDTSTTVARTRIRLRENTGGTCVASSPIVWTGDFGPLPGTQAAGMALQGPLVVPFPDGIEFPAADSICLSELATTNTTAVLSVTLNGYEY